jgi:hypothetical protein
MMRKAMPRRYSTFIQPRLTWLGSPCGCSGPRVMPARRGCGGWETTLDRQFCRSAPRGRAVPPPRRGGQSRGRDSGLRGRLEPWWRVHSGTTRSRSGPPEPGGLGRQRRERERFLGVRELPDAGRAKVRPDAVDPVRQAWRATPAPIRQSHNRPSAACPDARNPAANRIVWLRLCPAVRTSDSDSFGCFHLIGGETMPFSKPPRACARHASYTLNTRFRVFSVRVTCG